MRTRVEQKLRGAGACGMLAMFSRTSGTFVIEVEHCGGRPKVRFGRMPKPARCKRALPGPSDHAFTLIELLVVMTIIVILAGLVVATTGYVQEKGKRSRAEAEIAAMSAALESYKADNGIYPTGPASEALDPTHDGDSETTPPNAYTAASLELYGALTGTTNGARTPPASAHSYFTFKPQMLYPAPPSNDPVKCIRDPFGNSYGYSTMKAATPNPPGGYNPTFDLWSTGGEASEANPNQAKWIKNW